MFKKNSWIVALLLALTLTAFFTGCIDALVEEKAEYEEVELGDFNVWGGQNYQYGWASAGLKFKGVGDKPEVAKDKGYDSENFIKATKLKVEMEDSTHPSGNLDIIWGAADDNGDSVGEDWVQTGAIPFTKDGNTIIIDLTAMGGYSRYKDSATGSKRKIILQAGGESAGLTKLVKKAWLMIPIKEEPFVSVTSLTLKRTTGVTEKAFELIPVITPDNATVKAVKFAIFKDSNTAKAVWADENLQFDVGGGGAKSKTKIISNEPGGGTVKIRATMESAKIVKAADGSETYEDVIEDFVITLNDPVPFKYKVDGVEQTTKEYEGVANAGAESVMTVETATPNKYTITMTGNSYGNAYSYFQVDLGSNKIMEFDTITFTYTPVSGDASNKTIRVKAALDPPPSTYNPGLDIARTTDDSSGPTMGSGDTKTLTLGTNGTTADAFAAQLKTLSVAETSNTIYLWFLPWSDGTPTVFSISDVELKKKAISYKLGSTTKTTTNYAGLSNGLDEGKRFSFMKGEADGSGFTITMSGNSYGNAYSYLEVDFGTGNIGDYTSIKFTYTPVSGDVANKTIRVKAAAAPPPSNTYNPGLDIARTTDYSTGPTLGTGDTKTLTLGNNGDTAGAWADNLTTLSTESKIYIWFLPWSDGSDSVFKITNIEFVE